MTTTPAYTLVVKAVDSNTKQLTGSTTVSVQVTADGNCNGAAALAFSILTILAALVVTL